MDDNDRSPPLYKQIHQRLADRIRTGALPTGTKLPSEQQLCDEFGVSKITVKHALSRLANEGLIERIPGRGSFVMEPTGEVRRVKKDDDSPLLVAVVVDDFGAAFGDRLLYSIEEECGRRGYRPVLYRSRNSMAREEAAVKESLRLGVAGLIVNPVHGEFYSKSHLQLIIEEKPLVFVGNFLAGLAAPYSGTDNFEAARSATKYLFDRGHRYIAFLSPRVENTFSIERRRDGYHQAHRDVGMVPDPKMFLDMLESATISGRTKQSIRTDIDRIAEFLTGNPKVTAVLAEEYSVATLIHEAATRIGKTIPEDISVISFDSPKDWLGNFSFTHMSQQEEEMGRNAVRLLHERIQGSSGIRQVLIPAQLEEGPSTDPPPPSEPI